jgi:hypothetical protein
MAHRLLVFRSLPKRKPVTLLTAIAKLRSALNSKAEILGATLVLLYLIRVSVLSLWAGPARPVLDLCGQAILVAGASYLIFKGVRKFLLAGIGYIVLTFPGVLMSEYFSQSFMKWAGWVLLFAIVGPVLQSEQARGLRQAAWQTFKIAFIVISIVSFFWYILRLPNLGRGAFTGVMMHSMLIGPIAGMAFLFCAHSALFKRSLFAATLGLLCLGPCLLSGSRSAALAVLAGVVVLTGYQVGRLGVKKSLPFMSMMMLLGLLGTFFVETIQQADALHAYTSSLQEKGLQNTRENLWQARLDEFYANSAFGVGVGMGEEGDGAGIVVNEAGSINIEPGSSYLAILSMTGVAGAVGFIIVIAGVFRRSRIIKRNFSLTHPIFAELYIIAAFLFTHMVAEGWIYAVGNPFCLLFWLCLGRRYDLVSVRKLGAKAAHSKVLAPC